MEGIKVRQFLQVGSDSGDGSDSGYGCGYGCGYGYDSGSGSGSGYGYGYGSGYGIKKYDDLDVNLVDGVPTIITAVHGNAAKGYILHDDLTLEPCFIAKVDDHFAHGRTLREAVRDAQDKAFADQPAEQRIAAFLDEIKPNTAYPVMTFFDWHHRLTGSCEAGRKTFAKDHGINLNGKMTREEFFELTKDAYGGEIIRRAMEAANGKTDV